MTATNVHTAGAAPLSSAMPTRATEPSTLVEVFARAMRAHARPDVLNAKRDGRWRALSSEELTRRVRPGLSRHVHHLAFTPSKKMSKTSSAIGASM